jgi:methylated-DNA-[protein]-cysteine S-methyltransferase
MTLYPSPLGPIAIAARDGHVVSIWFDPKEAPITLAGDRGVFDRARTQLDEYFAGERAAFDLPLAPNGTAFQSRVWAALQTIPLGRTCSYGELAKVVGKPTASRAVGAANGQNRIGIVIPCHRVIGADGSLTGYAAGVERKKWLLDHEAQIMARRK